MPTLPRARTDTARLSPWPLTSAPPVSASSALVAASAVRCDRRPAVVPADRPGRRAAADRRRPQDQDGAAAARARAHLRRRRAHPRRQPARADASPSTGTCIRKRHRSGRDLPPPLGVGRRAGRGDGGALRRQASTAATCRCRSKEDVDEPVAVAIQERIEDFPGVEIIETWKRVYPYAPLASHVVGYMGAITAERRGSASRTSATTRRSTARRSASSASSCPMEQVLHGKWGEVDLRGRRRQPHRARAQLEVRRSTAIDVQLTIDLDYSSTPSGCWRPSSRLKRQFVATNPEVLKPDGDARAAGRSTSPSAPSVPYKAPAGSTIVMNYQTGAGASRWPATRRSTTAGSRPDVASDKFDQIFPTTEPDGGGARPRPVDPRQPGRSRAGTTSARRSSCSPPTPRWPPG